MLRRLSTGAHLITIICWMGIHAPAQEVITGLMHWYYPEDEGAQLPAWKRKPHIDYPERLKGSPDIFYVIVPEQISREGMYRAIGFVESGSQGLVEEEAGNGFAEAKALPAERDGRAADAHVWETIIFNPVAASVKTELATARLLEVWPAFMPKVDNDRMPRTRVKIRISPEGSAEILSFVGKNEPEEAIAAASKKAVAKWKFAPARKGGQAVESELELPVLFLPVEPPEDRNDWPPEALRQVPPDYPYAERAAGRKGKVRLGFIVNENGVVEKAQVLASNNPQFDQPAIKAVLQWSFKPARQRGRPVKARVIAPILFELNNPGGGEEAYTVDRVDQTKLPPELRYDQPPRLINVAFAVYPRELLEQGVNGRVEVRFFVEPNGLVGERQIASTTHPQLAQATMAMLDASRFDPARKKGSPTRTAMSMVLNFKAHGDGNVPVSEWTKDLLALVKKQRPSAALKDLDGMPKARSQRAPVFPAMRQRRVSSGEAVVEFYIGEDGAVLLPQAVSASAEEFGYAAVQAVSQWLFEPPRIKGKPVLVRAQIPFDFKLQPETSGKTQP